MKAIYTYFYVKAKFYCAMLDCMPYQPTHISGYMSNYYRLAWHFHRQHLCKFAHSWGFKNMLWQNINLRTPGAHFGLHVNAE